jgi:sulfite reductase alpha subunit-like flavoprotein
MVIGCSAAAFYTWLDETRKDFRVAKELLKNVNYAVFGLGHSDYGKNFNAVARKVDHWLHQLSANRMFRLGQGDENVGNSKHGGMYAGPVLFMLQVARCVFVRWAREGW